MNATNASGTNPISPSGECFFFSSGPELPPRLAPISFSTANLGPLYNKILTSDLECRVNSTTAVRLLLPLRGEAVLSELFGWTIGVVGSIRYTDFLRSICPLLARVWDRSRPADKRNVLCKHITADNVGFDYVANYSHILLISAFLFI